jgi:hypothetical protein
MTIAAAPDRDAYLDAYAAALAAQLPPFTDDEAAAVARVLAAIELDRANRVVEVSERAA